MCLRASGSVARGSGSKMASLMYLAVGRPLARALGSPVASPAGCLSLHHRSLRVSSSKQGQTQCPRAFQASARVTWDKAGDRATPALKQWKSRFCLFMGVAAKYYDLFFFQSITSFSSHDSFDFL